MVAVVAGTGLGILDSTLNQSRGAGALGVGSLGQSGGSATVNLATGNLVLQFLDESLAAQGADLRQLRTYNSQGETGAGERWRLLGEKRIDVVNGTPVRTTGDGHEASYILVNGVYSSSEGGGADDTLRQEGSVWVWTDGSTGAIEVYGADGWIQSAMDVSGSGFMFEFADAGADGDQDLARVISYTNGAYNTSWGIVGETKGQTLVMGYDTQGRLDTLSTRATPDGAGLKEVYYQYDTEGRLEHVITDLSHDDSIADDDTYVTTYGYDGNSLRIASIEQSDGTTANFGYELVGGEYKVTSVSYGDLGSQVIATTYQYLSGQTVVTNGENESTRYSYDTNDTDRLTLIETLNAAGSVVQTLRYTYYADGKNNVQTVTDKDNNTLSYEYDNNSNITREEDALGNVVERTWTSANRLETETRYASNNNGTPLDPETSRFVYDAEGRLRLTLSAQGRVSETRYNALGQVESSIVYTADRYNVSALAQTAVPSLSDLETTWLSSIADLSKIQRTDFEYDQIGNLQRQTVYGDIDSSGNGILNASASRSEYVYDVYGRLLQSIDNVSVAEAMLAVDFNAAPPSAQDAGQDRTGTVVVQNDGAGLQITGNRWQQIALNNYDVTANTVVEFDLQVLSEGEIIALGFANADGDFSGSGFQLAGTQPWGASVKEYSYAGNGAWEHMAIRAGDYLSGSFSRLFFVGDADSGAVDFTIANIRIYEAGDGVVSSHSYDGMGRQVSSVSSGGISTTTYGNGQVRSYSSETGLSSLSSFDKAGRMTSLSVSGDGVTRVSRYYYDDAGREIAVENVRGEIAYTFYDEQGRVAYTVTPTSSTLSLYPQSGLVTGYSYNSLGQLEEERSYFAAVNTAGWLSAGSVTMTTTMLAPAPNATKDSVTRYTYDANGRAETTTQEFGDKDIVTTNFYDGAGRIVKTTVGDRSTRYYYDADGRQVGLLDAENQLAETRYDAAGRVVATLRYEAPVNSDAANVITDLDAADLAALVLSMDAADSDTLVSRYFYDAQGRQVAMLNEQGYLTETEYNIAGRETLAHTWMTNVDLAERGKSLQAIKTWLSAQPDSDVTTSTTRFDGFGRVSRIEGHDGTVTRNVYDQAGRLVRTITAESTVDETATRTQYNAFGEVIGVVSGEGEARISQALIAGEVAPAGSAVVDLQIAIDNYGQRFEYDAMGRKVAELGPEGQKTLYFYNNAGQLTYVVNALGEVSETSYHSFGQIKEVIVVSNRIDLTGLNGGDATAELKQRVTDAKADNSYSRLHTSYNQLGLKKSVTESVGDSDVAGFDSRVTRYEYDRYGQLETTKRSVGKEANGEVAWRLTRYAYDNLGRVTDTWADDGGLSSHSQTIYDGFGRTAETRGPSGEGQVNTYIDGGRQITVRHTSRLTGLGVTTRYDAMGRELSVTDQRGKTTNYKYDDVARSVEIASPEGVKFTTWNTRTGQTLRVEDGENNVTRYTYDRDGNVKTVTDALDNVNESFYDKSGRLYEQEDAEGNLVRFEYDASNRMVRKIIDPEGLNLVTGYEYDGQGRKLYVHEGVGSSEERSTEYRYDRTGRLVQEIVDANVVGSAVVSEKGADALQLSTRYFYDDAGDQVRVTRGTVADPAMQTTEYEFDSLGRKTKETVAPGVLDLETFYRYDESGNVTRVISANNQSSTWQVYNERNQPTHVINTLGQVVAYEYDDNGRLIHTRQYARVLDTSSFGDVVETGDFTLLASNAHDRQTRNIYNDDGQQTFTLTATAANEWVVTQNVYDNNGNIIETRRYDKALSSLPESEAATITALKARGYRDAEHWGDASTSLGETRRAWYAFDDSNRLAYTVNATGNVVENVYDAVGNVTHTVRHGATLTVDDNLLTAAANLVATRQASDPAVLANVRITEYAYDNANRLVDEFSPTVTVNSSDGSTLYQDVRIKTHTDYDALGQVIMRTEGIIVDGNVEDASQARITEYAYDAVGRQRTTYLAGYYSASAGQVYKDLASAPGDAFRRTTDVLYDDLGNAVRNEIRVGNGANDFVYQYKVYDEIGREVYDIDAEGHVTGTNYNDFGLEETATRFSIDLDDFAAQKPGAYWTKDVLDGIVATDANSRTITNLYDAAGRKTHTLMPAVGAYYVAPEATSSVQVITASTTDLAPQTEFEYNAFGEVIRQRVLVSGSSGSAVYADSYSQYDAIGRVVKTIDALGHVTRNEYDSLGNLERVTEYAQAGLVSVDTNKNVTITAAANNDIANFGRDRIQRFDYDGMGRVTDVYLENVDYAEFNDNAQTPAYSLIRKGEIHASQTTYTGFGETDISTDALGNETDYDYNNLGQVTQITLPAREVGGVEVGVSGTANAQLDPFVNSLTVSPVIKSTYDIFGNVVEQIAESAANVRGETITLASEFDHSGNMIRSYDGEGNPTAIKYDSNGRVIEERKEASAGTPSAQAWAYGHDIVRQYRYDNVGNQTRTVDLYQDASGYLQQSGSRQELNAFGEVLHEYRVWTTTDNVGVQREHEAKASSYLYDEAGRISFKRGSDGFTHYYYDLAGNMTRSEQREQANNTTTQRVSEVVYDLLGRSIQQRQPFFVNQAGETLTPRVNQNHDRWGNVTATTDALGNTTHYLYNHENKVVGEWTPAENAYNTGDVAVLTNIKHSMDYDALGRAVVDRHQAYQALGYDREADINSVSLYGNSNYNYMPYASKQSLNVYDEAGNLTVSVDATQRRTENSYDIHGNRIATRNGIGTVTVMDYDSNGQVTEQKILRNRLVTPRQDDYGNALSPTITLTAYDDSNTLSANYATMLNEFEYDQAGRKYRQTAMGGLNEYFAFDERNNVTNQIDVMGNMTRYRYDELGNKTAEQKLAPVIVTEDYLYGYTTTPTQENGTRINGDPWVSTPNYTTVYEQVWVGTSFVDELPYGVTDYTEVYGPQDEEYISGYVTTTTSQRGSTEIWGTRQVEYIYGYTQTSTQQSGTTPVTGTPWSSTPVYKTVYVPTQVGTEIVSTLPYGATQYTEVWGQATEEFISGYTTTATSQRGSTEIWGSREVEYIYGYNQTSSQQNGTTPVTGTAWTSNPVYGTRTVEYQSGTTVVSTLPAYGSYEVVYGTYQEEYISGYTTTSSAQRGSEEIWSTRDVEYVYGYNQTNTQQSGTTPVTGQSWTSTPVWSTYQEQYVSGYQTVSAQPAYGNYEAVYSTRQVEYLSHYVVTSNRQNGTTPVTGQAWTSTAIYQNQQVDYLYGYTVTSTQQSGTTPVSGEAWTSTAIWSTRSERYVSSYTYNSYGQQIPVYSWRQVDYISGYNTPIYQTRWENVLTGYNTPVYGTRDEQYISGYRIPIYSTRDVDYISHYNTPVYSTYTEDYFTGNYNTPIYNMRDVQYVSGYEVPVYSTRQEEYIAYYETPVYSTYTEDYFTGSYHTPIYDERMVDVLEGYEIPIYQDLPQQVVDYYDTPVYRTYTEDYFTGNYNTPVYDTRTVQVLLGYDLPVYEMQPSQVLSSYNTPIYRTRNVTEEQLRDTNLWVYSQEDYELGQMTERSYINNTGIAPQSSATNSFTTLNYSYTDFGELEREYTGAANNPGTTLDYEYTENGLLEKQTDKEGQSATSRKIESSFDYDILGRRSWESHKTTDYVDEYGGMPIAAGSGYPNVVEDVEKIATLVTTYGYDKLNRLSSMSAPQAAFQTKPGSLIAGTRVDDLSYHYDEWGNRRAIHADYRIGSASVRHKAEYYTYDAEGRVVIADGHIVDGKIVADLKGTVYAYDSAGRMRRETSFKSSDSEYDDGEGIDIYYKRYDRNVYHYDDLGRVDFVNAAVEVHESFGYDDNFGYSRDEGSKIAELYRYNEFGYRDYAKVDDIETKSTFRRDGQVLSQTSRDVSDGNKIVSITDSYQYSNSGLMLSYTYHHYKNNRRNNEDFYYNYNYNYIQTYAGSQVKEITVNSDRDNTGTGSTINTYDHRGRLTFSQKMDLNRDGDDSGLSRKYFAYNAENKIIGSVNTPFEESTKTQTYFYYNGSQLADLGGEGIHIAPMELQRAGGSTPGTYSVNAGDTLMSIAQAVFGDGGLWYVLAENNAILKGPSERFTSAEEGTKLRIPNINLTAQNTANTFQPYNTTQIIGDMTPSVELLPPPEPSCNTFAIVLMVVVAVVVTIFTAGAALAAMPGVAGAAGAATAVGAASTSYMAIGGALLAGGGGFGLATAAAAFTGGFVGSVASQTVGKATGQVEHFSLRSAFSSGLTTVATMGLSYLGKAGEYAKGLGEAEKLGSQAVETYRASATAGLNSSSTFARNIGGFLSGTGGAVAKAVAGASSSYAANEIAGLDSQFSWKGLAAQSIGSYVGNKIGGYLGEDGHDWNPYIGGGVAGAIGGAVAGKLNSNWNGGGPVDYARIALDAFANQLGNALVSRLSEVKETSPSAAQEESVAKADKSVQEHTQEALVEVVVENTKTEKDSVDLQSESTVIKTVAEETKIRSFAVDTSIKMFDFHEYMDSLAAGPGLLEGGGNGPSIFSKAESDAITTLAKRAEDSGDTVLLEKIEKYVRGQITNSSMQGYKPTESQYALLESGDFRAYWKDFFVQSGGMLGRTELVGWGEVDFINNLGLGPQVGDDEIMLAAITWKTMSGVLEGKRMWHDLVGGDSSSVPTMEVLGLEFAKAHIRARREDNLNTPHLLNREQISDYHHQVLEQYGLPKALFGGTFVTGSNVNHAVYGRVWAPYADVDRDSALAKTFFSGVGYGELFYGPDSVVSQDFAQSHMAWKFMKAFSDKYSLKIPDDGFMFNYDKSFGIAEFLLDYIGDNDASHRIGSYENGFAVVDGEYIHFRVTNRMGLHSFAAGNWTDRLGIPNPFDDIPNGSNGGRTPFSNIDMTVQWTIKREALQNRIINMNSMDPSDRGLVQDNEPIIWGP